MCVGGGEGVGGEGLGGGSRCNRLVTYLASYTRPAP